MSLLLAAESLPLQADESGVVRIGSTRVSLASMIYDYKNGATAEQIAFDYPTLDLADIHAVIAYYLRHLQEVETYLAEQEKEAAEIRLQIESVVATGQIRERLLARRAAEAPH
jgi:uncharacterized protein (DUF433 family)